MTDQVDYWLDFVEKMRAYLDRRAGIYTALAYRLRTIKNTWPADSPEYQRDLDDATTEALRLLRDIERTKPSPPGRGVR